MFRINECSSTLTPEGILPILLSDDMFATSIVRLENTLLFLTVLFLRVFDFKKNYKTTDEVRINSDLLIHIMGRDYYKDIIHKLVELEIIECRNSYVTGLLPKSYKLKEVFLDQKPVARRITKDKVKNKFPKIENYFRKKLQQQEENSFLMRQFENLKYIHIDYNSAIEKTYELDLTDEQRISYINRINNIAFGFTKQISVSETNGRLFSAFTNLPKALRPYLYIQDENTGELIFDKVEIDGKNTQPVLLCIKMRNEGLEPDKDFYELCFNGNLYDQMATELNRERSWIKERMMDTILFTNQNSMSTHDMLNPNDKHKQQQEFSKYFMNRFPGVFKWLLSKKKKLAIDSDGETINRFNRGGSLLAIEIQKMESDLWIKHLLKEIPDGVIYFTIHDSIVLFNPDDEVVSLIEHKFKEICKRLYGVEMPTRSRVIEEEKEIEKLNENCSYNDLKTR
jgi:hypothetical protein